MGRAQRRRLDDIKYREGTPGLEIADVYKGSDDQSVMLAAPPTDLYGLFIGCFRYFAGRARSPSATRQRRDSLPQKEQAGRCEAPRHPRTSIGCLMSAKKKRAWFVCPQWQALVADHYSNDIEAARALHTDPRVLEKLRSGAPLAKSTVLKMLRQAAHRHPLCASAKELVVDTRVR